MKYLIIGLGNPGDEYINTRHNIGFKVLDSIAKVSNTYFSLDKLGLIAEVKYKGRALILLKPNTYMNLSGKAVNYWMQKHKVKIENILVITDDINLPLGKLRIKSKGSDGGHNGMKDIHQVLNTIKYPRLRFGIGNNYSLGNQSDFVLSSWGEHELEVVRDKIEDAKDAVFSFATIGIERTMNSYNNI
jgi:PTH1 family peptidyl-tRNA hydrolase